MDTDFEERKKLYEATEAWQQGGDRVAVLILRDLTLRCQTAYIEGSPREVFDALLGIMQHSREFAKQVLSAAIAYDQLHGEGPRVNMEEAVS